MRYLWKINKTVAQSTLHHDQMKAIYTFIKEEYTKC